MLRITLVTFLLVSFHGRSQSGVNVFDDSYIHEVRLTFDDTTFWDTLLADYNAVYWANPFDFSLRKYVMASTIELDGVVLDSVGLRLKGYSSGFTGSKRRHFKIDFGEFKDWKFDGLRKLNLSNTYQDGTMIKDALIYDWLRDMGVPAPRTSYFKLYLNDEYWGLYLGIEQVDKEFLEDNYVLADGNLYKPFYQNSLFWYGPDWNMYKDTLELRTNEGSTVHNELYDFLEYLDTEPDVTFAAGIDDVIDLNLVMTHFAADYFVSNSDSPFIGGRNYYLYADEFNGKIKTIPWDYNFSFNNYTNLITGPSSSSTMLRRRVEGIPEMRYMYFDKVCELSQLYTPEYFHLKIDAKADLISDQILLEPHFANWMPLNEVIYNVAITNLKDYFLGNTNRIATALSNEGFYCVLGHEENNNSMLSISPNPASDHLEIFSDREYQNLVIVNSIGKELLRSSAVNIGVTSIDCSSLHSGVYFMILESEGELERLKFEKVN